MLQRLKRALAQRLEHRLHAVCKVKQENNGKRELVLAQRCDLLFDAIIENFEIIRLQFGKRLPGLLVENLGVERDHIHADL